MKHFFHLLFLLVGFHCYGQNYEKESSANAQNEENMLAFNDLPRYYAEHLVYPQSARNMTTDGKVIVSFVVTDSGKVSDVKLLRSFTPDCDQAVLKMFSEMPKVRPARQNGKSFAVQYTQAITFKSQYDNLMPFIGNTNNSGK